MPFTEHEKAHLWEQCEYRHTRRAKHPLYSSATPVRAHLKPDALRNWFSALQQSVPSSYEYGDGKGEAGMNIAMNL